MVVNFRVREINRGVYRNPDTHVNKKKYIRMNPVGDEVGENLLKITIFSWIL
jgi:hypothetical protein